MDTISNYTMLTNDPYVIHGHHKQLHLVDQHKQLHTMLTNDPYVIHGHHK